MKIDNESTSTVQDETMADASSTAATAAAASGVSNAALALPPNRFELELEFVQSLASPAYLHYLATSGILYQSSFLDFLRYLRYWKRPEYAKYLIYPNCLYFLDLLVPPDDHHRDDDDDERKHDGQTDDGATEKASEVKRADRGEAFRREIAQVQFRNFVHEQQFYSWQFRSARLYGTGGAAKEAKDEEAHPESAT